MKIKISKFYGFNSLFIFSFILLQLANYYFGYTSLFSFMEGLLLLIFIFIAYRKRLYISKFLINQCRFYLIGLCVLILIFFLRPINMQSLIKLITFFIYICVFVYFTLIANSVEKKLGILKIIYISLFIFLIVSNLKNLDYPKSLSSIASSRYTGISGTNYHGIISTLYLCLSIVLKKSEKNNFFVFSIIYGLANLIITGSRASLISFILFLVILLIFRRRIKFFRLLVYTLICVLIIFISFKVISTNQNLLYFFRINEYSINGRINPLINAIDIIKENPLLGSGLGKVNFDLARNNMPMDISILVLIVQSGIPCVMFFVFFISDQIKKTHHNLKYSINFLDYKIYSSCLALLYILLFHSFFETILFDGIDIIMITFLLLLSFGTIKQKEII